MRPNALALALVLGVALLWVPAPSVSAADPPEVLDRWWEPRYPIAPERVAIYARVTDPDGVQTVGAVWCYVPPFLCQYPSLYDDGTNGDAVAGDGLWTNGSIETDARVIGASFKLDAFDTGGNSVHLDAIYALFVDSLNISFEAPVVTAEPGQPFTVNGTAFYEDNASAPAEGISVTVSIPGQQQTVTVSANGSFEATLAAPSQDGTYTITAEAVDRTLTDSEQAVLAVTSIPTPDLSIGDLRTSTPKPVAGPVAVQFKARNIGTDLATDVRVLVELMGPSGPARVLLDVRVTIPGLGGAIPLVAQTSLAPGTHTVRVSLDPDDDVAELNEVNNVEELTIVIPATPDAGPPLLWIGVGGGGLVAAAAGMALVLRRKGRRDGA